MRRESRPLVDEDLLSIVEHIYIFVRSAIFHIAFLVINMYRTNGTYGLTQTNQLNMTCSDEIMIPGQHGVFLLQLTTLV